MELGSHAPFGLVSLLAALLLFAMFCRLWYSCCYYCLLVVASLAATVVSLILSLCYRRYLFWLYALLFQSLLLGQSFEDRLKTLSAHHARFTWPARRATEARKVGFLVQEQ